MKNRVALLSLTLFTLMVSWYASSYIDGQKALPKPVFFILGVNVFGCFALAILRVRRLNLFDVFKRPRESAVSQFERGVWIVDINRPCW